MVTPPSRLTAFCTYPYLSITTSKKDVFFSISLDGFTGDESTKAIPACGIFIIPTYEVIWSYLINYRYSTFGLIDKVVVKRV